MIVLVGITVLARDVGETGYLSFEIRKQKVRRRWMETEVEVRSIDHCEAMEQFFIADPKNAVSLMKGLVRQANEFEDAAEFEARVAVKLSTRDYIDLCADRGECEAPHFYKHNTKDKIVGCNMCTLCVVRLDVEEEMEEEGKRV